MSTKDLILKLDEKFGKMLELMEHNLAVNHAILAELKQQGIERETLLRQQSAWSIYAANCITNREQGDFKIAIESINRGRPAESETFLAETTTDTKHTTA